MILSRILAVATVAVALAQVVSVAMQPLQSLALALATHTL